jgi:hypothetical protein
MNADDADLNGGKNLCRRFTLMNADQERLMKFEAENNYNKGFRLTRQSFLVSFVRRGELTPTTETQRHGEEQQSEQNGCI